MQIPNILKVIYAPHKAFKEIAEKPTYMGPLLIVILFVAANAGFAYVAVSKTYVEQILPDGQKHDEWTQNTTLWTSNALVSESSDSINGTYYGNVSISFVTVNSAQVWMQLNNVGPVNSTGADGYSKITFRIKQISPLETPQNMTIYAFSTSPSNYFYYDLTQNFSSATYNIWNNITVPLVSGWSRDDVDADWGRITGLKLEFTWPANSNITLLIDGLFFHGNLKSLLESGGNAYLLNFALTGAMQFVVTWVVLGGLLYLLSKTLGAKLVWRILLIVIGFVLITMVVQAVINIAAYSTLSNVSYPFELIGGVPGEGDAALNTLMEQTGLVNLIGRYIQIAIYIWTIALSALAVHVLGGLSWTKSFLAATVAYLATIFVGGFLFG